MKSETAALRQFLSNRFNDQELQDLCHDYFFDVYNDFAVGMKKGAKINLLLDHCKRHDKIQDLLSVLRHERPSLYEQELQSVSSVWKSNHLKDNHLNQGAKEYFRLWISLMRVGLISLVSLLIFLTLLNNRKIFFDTLSSSLNSFLSDLSAPIAEESFIATPTPAQMIEEILKPTSTPELYPMVTRTSAVDPTVSYTRVPSLTISSSVTGDLEGPPSKAKLHDTWRRSVDEMLMVFVPSGTFQMGSTEVELEELVSNYLRYCKGDDCNLRSFERELPAYEVALNDFWIDKTEVTNSQFAEFLNENGNEQVREKVWWLHLEDNDAAIEFHDGRFRPKAGFFDHPVIEVSWYGANAYCEWVQGRLPTEEEWEYAARGKEGLSYPWGNQFDGSLLNYCDSSCPNEYQDPAFNDRFETTAPVGSFPLGASWVGALDMAGNVLEWTLNQTTPSYSKNEPFSTEEQRQYTNTRTTRGGSWNLSFLFNRTAKRSATILTGTYIDVGFRCVYN
ncbi:MAG: SUMF1/EgtB/PvdO family nonheme iron enzyme [Chloroflexota bacterium]